MGRAGARPSRLLGEGDGEEPEEAEGAGVGGAGVGEKAFEEGPVGGWGG